VANGDLIFWPATSFLLCAGAYDHHIQKYKKEDMGFVDGFHLAEN